MDKSIATRISNLAQGCVSSAWYDCKRLGGSVFWMGWEWNTAVQEGCIY